MKFISPHCCPFYHHINDIAMALISSSPAAVNQITFCFPHSDLSLLGWNFFHSFLFFKANIFFRGIYSMASNCHKQRVGFCSPRKWVQFLSCLQQYLSWHSRLEHPLTSLGQGPSSISEQ